MKLIAIIKQFFLDIKIKRRIKKLRELNMIEFEKTSDRHRYKVNPTEELFLYFDQLGNSMKAIGKMHLKSK